MQKLEAKNQLESLLLCGIIKSFASLRNFIKDKYYKSSYQKFFAFSLIEYKRIVYMDADGFTLKNLDHLFFIDFGNDHSGNPVQMAAPQGYYSFGCKGNVYSLLV